LTENPTHFSREDWAKLTFYSHTHKKPAFDTYARRYLATSGQIYWEDWQLSAAYVDNLVAQAVGQSILVQRARAIAGEVGQLAKLLVDAAPYPVARCACERGAKLTFGRVAIPQPDEGRAVGVPPEERDGDCSDEVKKVMKAGYR
jgi:hypothetical protein